MDKVGTGRAFIVLPVLFLEFFVAILQPNLKDKSLKMKRK